MTPDYPRDFGTLFSEACANCPDQAAVGYRDQLLTYRRLSSVIDELTELLGEVRGQRVLVLLPEGLTTYCLHLRLMTGGACSIPLSPHSVTSYIQPIAERVQPHLVITTAPLLRRHGRALASWPVGLLTSMLEDNADVTLEPAAGTPPRRRAHADEPVRVVMFTSGSTGTPKGVCLGDRSLLAAGSMMVQFLRLDASRKTIVTVPMYDYYGLVQLPAHMMCGASWIVGESLAFPAQVVHRIEASGATDLAIVPFTLRKLLDAVDRMKSQAVRRLRWIQSSSDILTADLLERVFAANPDVSLVNIYGLTEAGRACYREIRADSVLNSSIGRPSPGVEMLITDTRSDGVGEIVIRGPNLMLGYLTVIEADRIQYAACEEVRTGDLGRLDAEGEIVLLGRRDHVINLGGEKIHPSEIERVALQAPGIQDARAYGKKTATGEIEIHLDVVAPPETISGLREHLKRNLTRVFVPGHVTLVAQIERTELGAKIVRQSTP